MAQPPCWSPRYRSPVLHHCFLVPVSSFLFVSLFCWSLSLRKFSPKYPFSYFSNPFNLYSPVPFHSPSTQATILMYSLCIILHVYVLAKCSFVCTHLFHSSKQHCITVLVICLFPLRSIPWIFLAGFCITRQGMSRAKRISHASLASGWVLRKALVWD